MYSKSKIIELLEDNSQNESLFSLADETRKKYVGDDVHLRGLIEFSNICKRQCKYCGLQSTNKQLERYRILPEEIVEYADIACQMGYKTIVLQSGEDDFYTTDILCDVVRQIKKNDVALTLSVGERSFDEFKALKLAGADRYLMRIETTDQKLYKELHPHMSFENRVQCLQDLKTLEYEVGTGCLVGLPNQTISSLADDILFFKEIGADMVGIGPFIPNPNTPLADFKPNDNFTMSLKVMALTRIIMKNINIPATTAMETLNPNGRIIALQSGANVVMPNVTTTEYRAKYEIYPGKICINENPEQCRGCISAKIKSIGRKIAQTKGNSLSLRSNNL